MQVHIDLPSSTKHRTIDSIHHLRQTVDKVFYKPFFSYSSLENTNNMFSTSLPNVPELNTVTFSGNLLCTHTDNTWVQAGAEQE